MSKKKIQEKRKKQKSYHNLSVAICIVILVAIVGFLFYAWWSANTPNTPSDNTNYSKLWSLDNSDRLVFSARGPIQVNNVTPVQTGTNFTVENVSFKSFGDDIYALLRKPTNVTDPPVVVVLPAATITKEADEPMAIALCDMGYASLTLDERGQGQTGGTDERDWQSGHDQFIVGGTPVQYKQIYDALKAYDYIQTRSDLDKNDVAILGESIGGMWAIVAAAEEPQYKGVITISSQDFDIPTDDPQWVRFVDAAQPSRYIGNLTPRKIAMFQFDQDIMVNASDGKALFDNASQPKAWHLYPGDTHGLYNSVFAPDLKADLKNMLGR